MPESPVSVGEQLPLQDPADLAQKAGQVRAQAELVSALRTAAATRGEPALAAQADRLEGQYAARESATLAADSYRSAAHVGQPPLGWSRASEHPELLRERIPGMTDARLHELLQPDASGFRAEIYIPDPAVFGPDAPLHAAVKGTSGLIVSRDASGQPTSRESATEDWINNARQGMGQESDYYTRGMDLATTLVREVGVSGLRFDGHSLSGGVTSAMSAVTGVQTTTFNAAGVNQATIDRYANAHGITPADTSRTVNAYRVDGEMLTNVQEGIAGMSVVPRAQVGQLVNLAAEATSTPTMRNLLDRHIAQWLPDNPQAQQATRDMVDTLATTSGAQLLAQVPLAVGVAHPLASMQRDAHGAIVPTPHAMTLSELGGHAQPVLNILTTTVAGARAYGGVGEVIAQAGQYGNVALDRAGDVVRAQGHAIGQGAQTVAQTVGVIGDWNIRAGGEAVAQVRLATGHAAAVMHSAPAKLQEWNNDLSSGVLRLADRIPFLHGRGLAEQADRQDHASQALTDAALAAAADALRVARIDASGIRTGAQQLGHVYSEAASDIGRQVGSVPSGAGDVINRGLDGAGHGLRDAAAYAPPVMAGIGAVNGATLSITQQFNPTNPLNWGNYYHTGVLVTQGQAAVSQALARHGMDGSVIPSLDAQTQQLELAASGRLRQIEHERSGAREAVRPAGAGLEDAAPARAPVHTAPVTPTPPVTEPAHGRRGAMLNEPGHPDYALFQGARNGIAAIDARMGRAPSIESEQLSGHLAASASQAGFRQINGVSMTPDGSRTFAVQGAMDDPAHQRVSVATMQGIQTPIAESTAVAEQARVVQSVQSEAQRIQETQEHARSAVRMA